MKKLFAIAIVAGMVFVSCNQKTEDAPATDQVDQEAVVNDEQAIDETAEMPTEEAPAQQ